MRSIRATADQETAIQTMRATMTMTWRTWMKTIMRVPRCPHLHNAQFAPPLGSKESRRSHSQTMTTTTLQVRSCFSPSPFFLFAHPSDYRQQTARKPPSDRPYHHSYVSPPSHLLSPPSLSPFCPLSDDHFPPPTLTHVQV